jgi:hypothetical protein
LRVQCQEIYARARVKDELGGDDDPAQGERYTADSFGGQAACALRRSLIPVSRPCVFMSSRPHTRCTDISSISSISSISTASFVLCSNCSDPMHLLWMTTALSTPCPCPSPPCFRARLLRLLRVRVKVAPLAFWRGCLEVLPSMRGQRRARAKRTTTEGSTTASKCPPEPTRVV